MTPQELASILTLHSAYLAREPHGVRADLRYADLRCADTYAATGLVGGKR